MKRARNFAQKVERKRNSSLKGNVIDQASLRAVVKLKKLISRSGLGGAELSEAVAEVRRQLLMETSTDGGDDEALSADVTASSYLRRCVRSLFFFTMRCFNDVMFSNS